MLINEPEHYKKKMSLGKGYDGIFKEHLKLINKDLSKCLTLKINQSLSSGIFPDNLKNC